MLKYIEGDLIQLALQGEFDVIVHGCNCFCKMGKGLALQIKQHFYTAYLADCYTTAGDRHKLGTYTHSDELVMVDGHPKFVTVVNAYIQYYYGKDFKQVDYTAIEDVFTKIAANYKDKKIGMPKLGAGLAGGDWDIISNIIPRITGDMDITVVNYNK